jgi:hypothetical protein
MPSRDTKNGGQHGTKPSRANKDDSKNDHDRADSNVDKKNNKEHAKDCTHHWEDAAHSKKGQEAYRKFKEQDQKSAAASEEEGQSDHSGSAMDDDQGQHTTKKRGLGANQKGSNKKQKNNGSLKEPQGRAGDKTRVPKEGQQVQWHSLPGYINGEVVEVVYEEKTVEGKLVKGSKEDPRIVLKSSASGNIAVHKPEAVYWD